MNLEDLLHSPDPTVGGSSSPHHGGFLDPWQQYKAISSRLKKRFLRKPNLAEASRTFASLAHRLSPRPSEPEDTSNSGLYHYAGFVQLAVARCEHRLGNVSGEAGGLRDAGRCFAAAHDDARTLLGLAALGEHAACAAHCYGHAIRVHLQHNECGVAGELCLELGSKLYNNAGRDQTLRDDAYTLFERAVRLLRGVPAGRLSALRWMITIAVEAGRYLQALVLIDEVSKAIAEAGASVSKGDGGESGARGNDYWAEAAEGVEVLTVLLLLKLRLLPKQMKPEHARLLSRYTDAAAFSYRAEGDIPATAIRPCNRQLQLYLHAFCLAVAPTTITLSSTSPTGYDGGPPHTAGETLTLVWPLLGRTERHLALVLVDDCRQRSNADQEHFILL